MVYAQHFDAEEFREWSDDMSARLVTMLDVLRFRLGSAIAVSASDYALGRELGVGKGVIATLMNGARCWPWTALSAESITGRRLRPWCMKLRRSDLLALAFTRTRTITAVMIR